MTEQDETLKELLSYAGWKLNVRTRKLARGPTKYFKVKYDESLICEQDHTVPRDLIKRFYPGVHLTSGSYVSHEFTFVEIWD
jgi:hypothetical protein